MPLVATKHQHIADLQKPVFARHDQFDAASLAGQVFTRTGLMRHTDHAASRGQFHSGKLQAWQNVRHEWSQPSILQATFFYVRRQYVLNLITRSTNKLLDRDLQCLRRLAEYVECWIRGARLKACPGRSWQAGKIGHALLRHVMRLAQASNIIRKIAIQVVHANRISIC